MFAKLITLTALTGLLVALTPLSADAAVFAKYDGVDGESLTVELSGLEIKPFEPEPSAALLLPAVQSAREAARAGAFARLACDGTVIPELEIELTKGGGGRPSLIYKLKDVIVTSYAIGMGDGDAALETAVITYTGLEFSYPETGETLVFDCTGGRCVCVPGR